MAHFRDSTLEPDTAIPKPVYAAIANAQLEHHPFKNGSASLNDLMSVIHDIRNLPEESYNKCVRAVLDTVMAVVHDGCNCYGRGLVYLRHITVGIDATIEAVGRELLIAATHVCPQPGTGEPRLAPPYEREFESRLEALGIRPVDEYEPVASDERDHRSE